MKNPSIEQIELNKEYISLITQMREINKKRVEVCNKFKKITAKEDIELRTMNTISIYHDLFGKDLDEK